MRHHAEGIFEAERLFGTTIVSSDGKHVPVRLIAEQHIREDCGGTVPTLADWLRRHRTISLDGARQPHVTMLARAETPHD